MLVDTNVFLIDRFFSRDENYEINKAFVEKLSCLDAYISIYNLFELLGLASFNLNEEEFRRWFYEFDQVYSVSILYPPNLENSLQYHFSWLSEELFRLMSNKITYVDALLLSQAEFFDADSIITWNKKDFLNRTEKVSILNPKDFIEKIEKEKDNESSNLSCR